MSKNIVLHNGEVTKVDDEDYEYLNQWKWGFEGRYVYRREYKEGKYKKIYLHRFLMNTPKGLDTDHINGDKMDNRRSNLRIATRSQNNMNQKPQTRVTSSKYKGVWIDKRNGKWVAAIKIDRKAKHLGTFATEQDAAIAYNLAAQELFGDYARTN